MNDSFFSPMMEVLNYDRLSTQFPTWDQAEQAALAYLFDEEPGCYFVIGLTRQGYTVDLFEEDGYRIGTL